MAICLTCKEHCSVSLEEGDEYLSSCCGTGVMFLEEDHDVEEDDDSTNDDKY